MGRDESANDGRGCCADRCGCPCCCGGVRQAGVACCTVAYSSAAEADTTCIDTASSAIAAADAGGAQIRMGAAAPHCKGY